MHHVVLDRWSRGHSPLHARSATAKLVVLLIFLIVVATTPPGMPLAAITYALLLVAGLAASRLPLAGLLRRAAVVLPFTALFALLSWLAGDTARAWAVLWKAYLSAFAVLLVVGTTPLPRLLGGLESLGAPRVLLQVSQFLYRYLFVISEQAQHMRLAAACRAGQGSRRTEKRSRFRAAAGILAVLFARSYDRAEGIHRAMLARGYSGALPVLGGARSTWRDAAFAGLLAVFLLAARFGSPWRR